MRNEFYISFYVQKEQIDYAKKLVEHSLKHHRVSNIWDKNKKAQTYKLRLTGTLGEVVFADAYNLPRPIRSFGAIDGQDFGRDFILKTKSNIFNIDVKTMLRKTNIFYKNYVLNIPARNIKRTDSITDYYFCINLHKEKNNIISSFLGLISKKEIKKEKIGILYPKGTQRIRADKTSFVFYEDTYEIFFENIDRPFMNKKIQNLQGFKKHHLR